MTKKKKEFIYPQNENRNFSNNVIFNNTANSFIDPTILDFKKEEYIENCGGISEVEFVLDLNNNVDYFTAKYIGHEDNISLNKNRGLLTTEKDFIYTYNKHAFRSKNFKKLSKENYNILTSGCSITFGHGLPEEFVWPNMLKEKIKNFILDKDIELYNLGSCGASTLTIIKNIFTFINLYGKPDTIFVLFTEMSRGFIYEEVNKKYVQVVYREDLFYYPKKFARKKWAENFVYEDILIINSTLIHILESFCKNIGIKLFWSSWVTKETEILKGLNFNNFVEIDKFETLMLHPEIINDEDDIEIKNAKIEFIENFRKKNINNLPYWEHARDLQHPGTCFSENISNSFLKEWEKND